MKKQETLSNETLLERVQRERKERRFARAEAVMRKALPKEIEEEDITWGAIISFLLSISGAAFLFLAFMVATIFIVAYFMPL